MKEMVYGAKYLDKSITLHSGKIDGFLFWIKSHGHYPCAFVGVPPQQKKFVENLNLAVHGTYRFMGNGLPDSSKYDKYFVFGWYYTADDDREGNYKQGKSWTTAEIMGDVESAIAVIRKHIVRKSMAEAVLENLNSTKKQCKALIRDVDEVILNVMVREHYNNMHSELIELEDKARCLLHELSNAEKNLLDYSNNGERGSKWAMN